VKAEAAGTAGGRYHDAVAAVEVEIDRAPAANEHPDVADHAEIVDHGGKLPLDDHTAAIHYAAGDQVVVDGARAVG
jgi:hypothetical protein